MNRRDLLRGLASLPVASVLASCSTKSNSADSEPQSRPSTAAAQPITTLKVVLDGSFAVVFDRRTPTRITAVIPHDPDKMHEFYLNNPYQQIDNGQDPSHSYSFQLSPKGLEENRTKRPYIDQCFRDFTRTTDVWKKEKYFVTVDLPEPDVISFIPPTVPVTFKLNHRSAMMPLNHVLRYRVQEAAAIEMTREGGAPSKEGSAPLKPVRDSEFAQEFSRWCKDPKYGGRSGHCPQMQQHSSDWFEENAITYYFAVGTPAYGQTATQKAQYHAENFYNNVLLRSFPQVQRELELESGGATHTFDYREGQIVPAVWQPQTAPPRLVLTASTVDCTFGGINILMPRG